MKRTTVELFMKIDTSHPPLTTVKGYHAFDMHGYSFVVHRKTTWKDGKFVQPRDRWCVSEASCGANVHASGNSTRRDAVHEAFRTISDVSVERLAENVKSRLLDRVKLLLGA